MWSWQWYECISTYSYSYMSCHFSFVYDMPDHMECHSRLYPSPAGGRCSIVAAGSDTFLRYCMHDSSRTHGYQHVYGHAV